MVRPSGVPMAEGRKNMAIKKSQLYSSLWQGCDELRGGMDASQYKDYVLVFLFIRYVSDKYAGKNDVLVIVPEGGSFTDLVKLKSKPNTAKSCAKMRLACLKNGRKKSGSRQAHGDLKR